MTDITALRRSAAETAFQDFEFDEGCTPEATNGWEDDGLGQLTRTLYLKDPDNPTGDTVKATFNVSFDAGSVIPDQVWATRDGNDIGWAVKPVDARAPGM